MTTENVILTFLIAMLPVVELRGSMPVAINVFHIPWPVAFLISVSGNILPVPLILLFLGQLIKFSHKLGPLEKTLNWILERTRLKSKIVERYAAPGLAIFVAIPLPATGAWTGAIIAFLLGMRWWVALLAISAGVIMAGAIVLALTFMGWFGAILAVVGFIILIILGLWKL